MSHIPRNLEYLNRRHIVYRRDPINDRPSMKHKDYNFYEDGTYECYQLFRSKAKITTYKSLKWHMLVLWYLNPQLDPDDFTNLCEFVFGNIISHFFLRRLFKILAKCIV